MRPSPIAMPAEKFWALPITERALLVAADRVGVREEGGPNRGFWVDRFLASVGLGPGHAWCAAFVTWCLREAGATKLPNRAAAVRNWARWAAEQGREADEPKRGHLFWWLGENQNGHIGFIVSVEGSRFKTIEGNTNAAGSREGDGVYRKVRTLGEMDARYDSGLITLQGLR